MKNKSLNFDSVAFILGFFLMATAGASAFSAHHERTPGNDSPPVSTIQNPLPVDAAMEGGNAQRSRVLSTRGLDAPPQKTLWKSLKLFQYRDSYTTRATSGPLSFMIDVPTFQSFTAPICANGVLFFTFSADNAYFYAIDALTGKELVVLKFQENARTALSAPAAIGSTVSLAKAADGFMPTTF